ncbi:MAG TPA: TrmJ/YjtD family RNA methyltransferase [Xanthobacteraceae bacterium]|nr:TrmJ/YjtD family RNA methyltransferase [Xanthobacteraceae bacterium]
MPGAGTDSTKQWVAPPGPAIVLVEPQIGENIGAAARVMANFGLAKLRLVNPRPAWPSEAARKMAAGADRLLAEASVFASLEAALADCTLVFATTARAHDQAKPVVGADQAARLLAERAGAGETVAVVFGRERYGLENHEIALTDQIITFPVNPAFASLNLAQAVAIVAYEWFKLAGTGLPFGMPQKSPPAAKQQLFAFFAKLERELEKVEYFRPPDKRGVMQVNLRNIFHRMQPTRQDIQTLNGVITALAEGRKGPARGGVLEGPEAEVLRRLLDEYNQGRVPGERGPVRGLSRLLRRNPTDAERALWASLTNDRRFTGRGFKRQTPVGPHILDFVSFPLRTVIELLPEQEGEIARQARTERKAWLMDRGYRVIEVRAREAERDVANTLNQIDAALGATISAHRRESGDAES